MARTLHRLGCAIALATVLTACGTGSGDGGGGFGKAPSGQSAEKAPAAPKLPLVDGFDNGKGWAEKMTWPGEAGASTFPATVAPEAGTVGYLEQEGSGYALRVRDAATGADEFRARAWNAPEPAAGSSLDGESGEEYPVAIPRVAVVPQGGKEYFVVWAHGVEEGDGVTKARHVIGYAVYPASGTLGDKAAPLKSGTQPMGSVAEAPVVPTATSRGLVLSWNQAVQGRPSVGVLLDAPSGKSTVLETEGDEVHAMTERGPVLAGDGRDPYYRVVGGWSGADFPRPPHSYATSAVPMGGAAGYLAVQWPWEEGVLDDRRVWGLLDAETGALVASTPCHETDSMNRDNWDRALHASPDGRYLASGPVLFDAVGKKAYCHGATEERKGVILTAVTDDGTAYGAVDDKDDPLRITVRAGEGETAKPLEPDALVPGYTTGKAGLFHTRGEDGTVTGFAVYARK